MTWSRIWINKTHGMSNTRFHNIYNWLKNRCNNKNNTAYKDYGGRWIKCEWLTFEEFKTDMYEKYLEHEKIHWTKNTTIDRRKNHFDGVLKNHYEWNKKKEYLIIFFFMRLMGVL